MIDHPGTSITGSSLHDKPHDAVCAPTSTLYKLSFTGSLPDTSGGQGLGHWMLSDSNGGLRGNDSRINFWAPIDGTYYVRVVQEGTPTAGRYLLVFHDNAGVTEPYPAYA